jgi:phosphoglycolate phosphatase-like HAD superfamily hydrolase
LHLVLFDIDGTLIASGGAGKAAMEAALRSEFGITELTDGVPYSGRTDRAIGLELLELHGLEAVPDNWHRLRSAYLKHLPASLARHHGQVLPGIIALLDHLTTRAAVAVGLLTGNIREGARLKLGHYRLDHHFAFGGFGDEYLDRDDVAREALAAGRQHLGTARLPGQVWVVGDTPLDIRCARAIGARVAAVATGWHPVEELAAVNPDLLLPDLADSQPFLRALADGPPPGPGA